MKDKKIIVIYHGNCPDGFSGAWAAWKKFGTEAQYFPVHHKDNPPPGLKNKTIYFIDIIYNDQDVVKKIVRDNTMVMGLDHHITAKENIELCHAHVFDNEKSGARIAWTYFHPEKPAPKLIQYIEDFDLWRFAMPFSKEIEISLNWEDFEFKNWSRIANDLEDPQLFKKLAEQGASALKYKKHFIQRLVSNYAYPVTFEGKTILAINYPGMDSSDVGAYIYEKYPPMALVWSRVGDTIKVSLRSDGSVDVAVIAQKYGGGGHASASGFSLSANEDLPWKTMRSNP